MFSIFPLSLCFLSPLFFVPFARFFSLISLFNLFLLPTSVFTYNSFFSSSCLAGRLVLCGAYRFTRSWIARGYDQDEADRSAATEISWLRMGAAPASPRQIRTTETPPKSCTETLPGTRCISSSVVCLVLTEMHHNRTPSSFSTPRRKPTSSTPRQENFSSWMCTSPLSMLHLSLMYVQVILLGGNFNL